MFTLRASKNLTAEDVNASSFDYSLSMMRKSVETKKGLIEAVNQNSGIAGTKNTIRSLICVPMVIKGRVIGVLYNDNSILKTNLEEKI